MPRTVSRKDVLRLGGLGLAGATLPGAVGCGRSLSGDKVVKFLTSAEETSIQERATIEIQVDRFEERHPKYTLEREVIRADEASTVKVMFTGFQEVLNGSRSPEVQAAALQEAWEKAKSGGDVPTQG